MPVPQQEITGLQIKTSLNLRTARTIPAQVHALIADGEPIAELEVLVAFRKVATTKTVAITTATALAEANSTIANMASGEIRISKDVPIRKDSRGSQRNNQCNKATHVLSLVGKTSQVA